MGALSFLPRLAALPVALLALCPLRATAAGEATFFAAPGGNDSHAGSQQQPFASLGRCLSDGLNSGEPLSERCRLGRPLTANPAA